MSNWIRDRIAAYPILRRFRFGTRADWVVVGWALTTKLVLFVFGAKTFQILQNQRVNGVYQSLQLWNHWDSAHYLRLAQFGYSSNDVLQSWFYPLFPWCVRFFAYFTRGDFYIAGLVVSAVAGTAAVVMLRRLVELDHSRAVALRSAWFLLIFPTVYFFHIAYTEALFISLVIGSIFAARTNRWLVAGVVGALAFATRPTGIVLIPALGVEAIHQWSLRRRWDWRFLYLAIVPVGFGIYLLVNWKITGDPFWFLWNRQRLFAMHFGRPWEGMWGAIGNFRRGPTDAEMVGAQELYFAILSLICTIASWFKLRPVHATWITGNYLLMTCVSFLSSMPRYALTLYPIFILFALLSANRVWRGVLTMASILFLGLFASAFVRGWWSF
jgi:hypothetical protein